MNTGIIRREARFQNLLLKSIGAPYKFGGRGLNGIDCSSLLMRAIRITANLTVQKLPWMTADQMARGYRDVTVPVEQAFQSSRCLIAFFDWDEDGIFEHVAARLLDGSWIWASTSAGKVIHVNPGSKTIWEVQWREIAGALDGQRSILRNVNWPSLHGI